MRFPSHSPTTATGLLNLLLRPVLLAAVGVQSQQQQHSAATAGGVPPTPSSVWLQPDAPLRLLSFPLHHSDESFLLSVDGLPLVSENSSCRHEDLANVTINGQSLNDFPAGLNAQEGLGIYASLHGIVSLTGRHDRESHALTLFIDAICHDTSTSTAEQYSRVFEFTITDIDRKPWTESDFTISHELDDGATALLVIRKPYLWPSDRDASEDIARSEYREPTISGPDAVELAEDVVEQEISKLRALQEKLQAVQQSVDQQKALVSNLAKDRFPDNRTQLKDCSSVTCVFKTLYDKGKECVHRAYLHLKANESGSFREDCYEMSSNEKPMLAKSLKNNAKDCPDSYTGRHNKHRPFSDTYTPLVTDAEWSEKSPLRISSVSDLGGEPSAAQHKIHATLALVASLLCLGCLTTLLHRRCCNPRARADRAARREERRSQRQFRCAARQRAWRDWWARRQCLFGGCRRTASRRLEDYEEKRALILQQEAVLENAMQDEIDRLHSNGGPGVMHQIMTMAEEGRLSHASQPTGTMRANESVGNETLPAYRSRSSSGRPPSYNEFDEGVGSIVADGFTNYTPSSSANDEVTSERSFGSDDTPESSVVDLSPRQSSDTLRTERSAL